MKVYICNAFALSMLDRAEQETRPRVPRPVADPRAWLAAQPADAEIISAVGHADAAAVYAAALGRPVPANRINIRLAGNDRLLVGQYVGPRLPEGATALPEGAKIEWWEV
jgi:hypothetical protein